ncbi:hypothetical protein ILYODFUR_002060 [Ilyodon furcidens]|uniref:Uncharacterized protein n=1 Tax=Ilyodon furcidens TaxID=33524 RepID=A0ABV0TGJ4_9TELE
MEVQEAELGEETLKFILQDLEQVECICGEALGLERLHLYHEVKHENQPSSSAGASASCLFVSWSFYFLFFNQNWSDFDDKWQPRTLHDVLRSSSEEEERA